MRTPYTVKMICQSLVVYGIGTPYEHVKGWITARKRKGLHVQQELLLSMTMDPLTAERFAVNKPYTLILEEDRDGLS